MGYLEVVVHATVATAPVERLTQAGKRYVTMSVIARDKATDPAEWISVAVFFPLVDDLVICGGIGARVFIAGEGKINRWVDRHGNSKAGLQLTATEFTVLSEADASSMATLRRDLGGQSIAGPARQVKPQTRAVRAKRNYGAPLEWGSRGKH